MLPQAVARSISRSSNPSRDAREHGSEIVIAEDVTSSGSAELHDLSMQHILPHIAVISSSAAISFKKD